MLFGFVNVNNDVGFEQPIPRFPAEYILVFRSLYIGEIPPPLMPLIVPLVKLFGLSYIS
jgi:hypothetical protein